MGVPPAMRLLCAIHCEKCKSRIRRQAVRCDRRRGLCVGSLGGTGVILNLANAVRSIRGDKTLGIVSIVLEHGSFQFELSLAAGL